MAVAAPEPTWIEPTVKKLDAEAVPSTSNLVKGEDVPMPTLPLGSILNLSNPSVAKAIVA